jgi:hypothetical protein
MYIENITNRATPRQFFNPQTRHSDSYYLRLLLTLAEGIRAGLIYRDVAKLLNERGILSPVGKPWTSTAVSQALAKLRNHKTKSSRLHHAFLSLVVAGELKPSEVSALFEQRIAM